MRLGRVILVSLAVQLRFIEVYKEIIASDIAQYIVCFVIKALT
jgi:hypothetical protein